MAIWRQGVLLAGNAVDMTLRLDNADACRAGAGGGLNFHHELASALAYLAHRNWAVDTGQLQKAGWSSPPPVRWIVYDRPTIGPLPRLPGRDNKLGRPRAVSLEFCRFAFVLEGRPRPPVEETLKIAEIARWALIRSEDGVQTPPELLGRDDDPEHAHASYLPEDADGDGGIDHLIVYYPKGFFDEARCRLDRLITCGWRTAAPTRMTIAVVRNGGWRWKTSPHTALSAPAPC